MSTLVQIHAQDGRLIDVTVDGPDDGETLLFHTGTPAAGVQHPAAVQAAAERGLRHLTYSRPGYAGSDRDAGRTVVDCVEDVRAIVDQLGIARFVTIGLSGGGPHALACAAELPERVIAAATIGSVAPRDAGGIDWLEGMGDDNHAEFGAAESGPDALADYLEPAARALAAVTHDEMVAAFGDLVSQVDRDVVTGEFATYLAANSRLAMRNGMWGWLDDDLAFVRDWGFDPASITRPLTVWQGVQDRFVPPSHGEWLASRVPGAELQLRPEHGHLSLWTWGFGEIVDRLVAAGAA